MNFGFRKKENTENNFNPEIKKLNAEVNIWKIKLEHDLMIRVGIELQKQNIRFKQEYVDDISDDVYLYLPIYEKEKVSKIIEEIKIKIKEERKLDSKVFSAANKKSDVSDNRKFENVNPELYKNSKVIKGKTIENRKRDRRITLRMTEEEYINLLKKVDASGENTTDFLNELIAKGHVRTLKIPIASEELVDEIHEIKNEIKAMRTTNGKTAGLIKKAIHLNEGNGWMNENDFQMLKKYLNIIEERNKKTDEMIADAERKIKNLWQT